MISKPRLTNSREKRTSCHWCLCSYDRQTTSSVLQTKWQAVWRNSVEVSWHMWFHWLNCSGSHKSCSAWVPMGFCHQGAPSWTRGRAS
jgi:hypothetical protein